MASKSAPLPAWRFFFLVISFPLRSGFDVAMKVRHSEEELQAIGPDFDTRWKEFFSPARDKPVLYIVPAPLSVILGLLLALLLLT